MTTISTTLTIAPITMPIIGPIPRPFERDLT